MDDNLVWPNSKGYMSKDDIIKMSAGGIKTLSIEDIEEKSKE